MKTTVLRFVGGAGSGKSTALHAFAEERSAAGVKCLLANGDSTLAAVRQMLAMVGDYKAVLLDEVSMPRQSQEDFVAGLMDVGLDHIVVACSRHPAEMERDLLLEQQVKLLTDLRKAARTLRKYETLHRAKNTDESTAKAEVNAELATRFEATIAKVQASAIAVHDGAKDAATVQERCLGDGLAHAWKTGPASHGRSDIGLLSYLPPEQIAQEEEDKAIHQMGLDGGFSGEVQDFARHLYRAGYRKQVAQISEEDTSDIDFSIKPGDIVQKESWPHSNLEVVDVNWALRAVAVRLGPTGGIVVWPAGGMKKVAP